MLRSLKEKVDSMQKHILLSREKENSRKYLKVNARNQKHCNINDACT